MVAPDRSLYSVILRSDAKPYIAEKIPAFKLHFTVCVTLFTLTQFVTFNLSSECFQDIWFKSSSLIARTCGKILFSWPN